jgi:hypothetical protein
MRFFRRGPSPEEQYKRYQTATEAVAYGILTVDDPQIQAARSEMLERMGPAFDPTVPAWDRLQFIDPGFREFVTRTITPANEDPRDLDDFAEQILAIVGLHVENVTGAVIADAANNFVETTAIRRSKALRAQGVSKEIADSEGAADARDLALRYFAFARSS